MKTALLFLGLALMPALSQAQSKTIDAFQRKYKGAEEGFSLNVSGNLLRLIMWFDKDDQEPEMKELMKGVRKMKLLKMPSRDRTINLTEFRNLKQKLQKEAFEELMSIGSGDGTTLDILIQGKDDHVSELLVLANGDNDFVVLDFRGKMDLEKIIKMASSTQIKGM